MDNFYTLNSTTPQLYKHSLTGNLTLLTMPSEQAVQLIIDGGLRPLVCLATLTAIDKHWYQIETARKSCRQLGGRALLADEVGLGKQSTGLILSEYLARGMINQWFLPQLPSSLNGNWVIRKNST